MRFWNKIMNKSKKDAHTPTAHMSVKRVTLIDIPEEIVIYIARFLMIEDGLHLSMTCKTLYHMLPKYSFEYKKIDMKKGIISGSPWKRFSYFDSPPLSSNIFMATISGTYWTDGNKAFEGIFIQLIRPQYGGKESIVIARHHFPLKLCAESVVHFLTIEDSIINLIQPGDYFRFRKDVGAINFRVHTRGICNKQMITAQKRDRNGLMQDGSGRFHTEKERFANIIEMFKKQDEKEMFKEPDKNFRTVMKRFRRPRYYVHDYLIEGTPSNSFDLCDLWC